MTTVQCVCVLMAMAWGAEGGGMGCMGVAHTAPVVGAVHWTHTRGTEGGRLPMPSCAHYTAPAPSCAPLPCRCISVSVSIYLSLYISIYIAPDPSFLPHPDATHYSRRPGSSGE